MQAHSPLMLHRANILRCLCNICFHIELTFFTSNLLEVFLQNPCQMLLSIR